MNLKIKLHEFVENFELSVDKCQCLDDIKLFIDGSLDSNKFYTNVFVDLVFKNCILNENKKVSFYKISSNDEIWIGNIEHYLSEENLILEIFLAGIISEMIRLILKKDSTISDALSLLNEVISDVKYYCIYDVNGNVLKEDQMIREIYSNKWGFKIILCSKVKGKRAKDMFKECTDIHDEYIKEEFLWRFNWDIYSVCIDGLESFDRTLIIDRSLWFKVSNDWNDDSCLSDLPASFTDSKLLFCTRMIDRIFFICRDHLRWTIKKTNQDTFDEMVDYFQMAICVALVDYLNFSKFLTKPCKKSIKDILLDVEEYLRNSQNTYGFLYRTFQFWNGFLMNPVDVEDSMVEDMHFKYWFVNMEIHNRIHVVKLQQKFHNVRQMKKCVSIQTGFLIQDLFVYDTGMDKRLADEEYLDIYYGKYHIGLEMEKIKVKVQFGGHTRPHGEVNILKGWLVDDIKHLIDESLNTSEFYYNACVDVIFKNCILSPWKPVSYYKVATNDEIWIGQLENYLKSDDVILDVFFIGMEQNLVHLIVKKNYTVSDVVLMMQQVLIDVNCMNLWTINGTEVNCTQTVEEIFSISGHFKIIMNGDSHGKLANESFASCIEIYDKYLLKEFFRGLFYVTENINEDISLDQELINEDIKEEMTRFISLLQSNISKDSKFNETFTGNPESLMNSEFLFTMRMKDHLLSLCGAYLRLAVNRYEWSAFSDIIEYFQVALCGSVMSYLSGRKCGENLTDLSLADIVNEAGNYLLDERMNWKCFLDLFSCCLHSQSFDEEEMERLIFKSRFWNLILSLHGFCCEIRMEIDIKIVRQIKKIVSLKTGMHVSELHMMERDWNQEFKDDVVLEITKCQNDAYYLKVLIEKINIKVTFVGVARKNCEVDVGSDRRLDEIKYLIDKLCNTNDLYCDNSLDMIYKNCVLNERKPISYYNIKSNDEIWIGRIEDYLKQQDVVFDIFMFVGVPELIHLIVKLDITVADVLLMIQTLYPGFQSSYIWNAEGNEVKIDEKIGDIVLTGHSKILIGWAERDVKLFEEVCRIHDKYMVENFLIKVPVAPTIAKNSSIMIEHVKNIEEGMTDFISFVQSDIMEDPKAKDTFVGMSRPFINSELLFPTRIADRIFDFCKEFWKVPINRHKLLVNGGLHNFFHLALCIVLSGYVKSFKNCRTILQRNSSDEPARYTRVTIPVLSEENAEKSYKDIIHDALECLKCCEDYGQDLITLFLGRHSFSSLSNDEITEIILSDDAYIKVKIHDQDHFFKMTPENKSIKEIKKEICRPFKMSIEDLYFIEIGGNIKLDDDEIFQVDKFLNDRYLFEYIIKLDDNQVLKNIGSGGYGKIILCENKQSGKKFVVKQSLDQNENVYRDISISYQIGESENMAKYLGLNAFDGHIGFSMEYFPMGSLKQYIEKNKYLPEIEVAKISRDILYQIKELHDKGIIHRDIKPDNILLDEKGCAKLIDLGVAKMLEKSVDYKVMDDLLASSPGTMHFMAPEISNEPIYTNKVDIWSFGVTVIVMITGHEPYPKLTPFQAANRISKTKKIPYKPPMPITDKLKEFIESCLHPSPEERSTAEELLQFKFIVDNVTSGD